MAVNRQTGFLCRLPGHSSQRAFPAVSTSYFWIRVSSESGKYPIFPSVFDYN